MRLMRTVLRQDTALVALAFVQVRVYDAIVVERLEPLVEVQVHDLVPRIYGIVDAVVSRIKQHLKVPVFECQVVAAEGLLRQGIGHVEFAKGNSRRASLRKAGKNMSAGRP